MSTSAVTPLAGFEFGQAPAINRSDSSILERTVCITIQLGGIGNRKKVSTNLIDVPMKTAAPEQIPGPEIEPTEDELALVTTHENEEPAVPEDGFTKWSARDHETGAIGSGDTEEQARRAAVYAGRDARRTVQDAESKGVDKSMLGVSKMLLVSPELKAIRKHDARIRMFVYQKCLPYKVGIHLLPIELVTSVEDQLKRFADEREILIAAFLAAYPKQIEAAGSRLLVLFNPADYKGLAQVRQAFTFDWQYVSFGTPGKLRDIISPALFAAEQEKAAKKWSEASEAIEQLLRAQMRDLIEKLREKLGPSPDGKPKTLRKESVQNLREFLEDFDIRNVTSDSELKALVERAKGILGNVDAEDIRSDEKLRADLTEGFSAIATELNDIVIEGGVRSISFEDE